MTALVHSTSQPFSLLFPPNPAFALNPPSGGILINSSRSPSSSPHARTRSLPGGSTSDTSASDRKIRFAPLPDPRKLSDEDEDEDYNATYGPDGQTNGLSVSPSNLSSSNSDDGNNNNTSSLSRESRWGKKFLKPFLNASPIKATFDDTGGGSKLGTALFRASSRDSTHSNGADQTDTSVPLSRRRSNGMGERPVMNGGLALRPTISADAPKKLLNGRVYGRKNQDKWDGKEPEFVEWGYGGMGSVRSGESFYQSVQSGSSVMTQEDDDDGSGMGWVRRRREQREREKAEKEQAAARLNAPQITVEPPSSPREEKSPPFRQEHDTATVAIPHHHVSHAQRTLSRSTSGSATPTAKNLPKELHIATDLTTVSRAASSPASTSTKSSEEEDDDEHEDSDDSEDTDPEEEEMEEARKTTTCAGVEKISRHRE